MYPTLMAMMKMGRQAAKMMPRSSIVQRDTSKIRDLVSLSTARRLDGFRVDH